MEYDLDPATALYGIAAFLGAITVVYFGSSLIFDLSPVTKSLAFLSTFIIFLSVSLYLSGKNRVRTLIALGMAGVSYLAFLAYTLGRFDFGQEGIFAALFLSSIAFVALGYLASNERLQVGKEHLKYLVAAILVLGGGLILVDILGSQPSYSLHLQESVTLEPGEDAVIGSLTVTNSFILPREVSAPSFSSCLGGDESQRGLYTSTDTDEIIGGLSEQDYNLTADVPPTRLMDESTMVDIQRTDSCPGERENETLYVFQHDQTEAVEYVD